MSLGVILTNQPALELNHNPWGESGTKNQAVLRDGAFWTLLICWLIEIASPKLTYAKTLTIANILLELIQYNPNFLFWWVYVNLREGNMTRLGIQVATCCMIAHWSWIIITARFDSELALDDIWWTTQQYSVFISYCGFCENELTLCYTLW